MPTFMIHFTVPETYTEDCGGDEGDGWVQIGNGDSYKSSLLIVADNEAVARVLAAEKLRKEYLTEIEIESISVSVAPDSPDDAA